MMNLDHRPKGDFLCQGHNNKNLSEYLKNSNRICSIWRSGWDWKPILISFTG